MKATVKKTIDRPNPDWLKKFSSVPPSIASDCLNRTQAMDARILSLVPGPRMCGFAVTVQSMSGNNLMSHLALTLCQPGDVLVIDGRGCTAQAIWGGIQALSATKAGVAGVVIDGVVRDIEDMINLGFPCYARGACPAGPHKGWADSINQPIQCGGIPVFPGDLVLGDRDGVVVVPQSHLEVVYEESLQRLAREKDWVEKIQAGGSSLEVVGLQSTLDAMEIEYLD